MRTDDVEYTYMIMTYVCVCVDGCVCVSVCVKGWINKLKFNKRKKERNMNSCFLKITGFTKKKTIKLR